MTNDIYTEIENLKTMINLLQWLVIWGAITFFISHLTIIINLPKIRRLCEKMCYETEENEEEE